MAAEPDFSSLPPEPEPSHSPEINNPHHDNRNLKAEMMLALGGSVSFGRFLAEPLEWVKWSAFSHNRYLEEAAVQARPGSVAQKKALFEAHYAMKKRKSEDLDLAGHDDCRVEAVEDGGLASWSSSAMESSSVTDESPAPGEVCGGCEERVMDCGGRASDGPGHVPHDIGAITDAVGHSCMMVDVAANEMCFRQDSSEQVSGSVMQSQEKHILCTGNLTAVDAVEKQPLKDITDSVKKRKLQMSSLISKPAKFSSPPSSKKGQSSSAIRQSPLHSAKENASPPSTEFSKLEATLTLKKRSTLPTLHISKSIAKCETVINAYSISRNLGTIIAERISQLESATRPTENSQPHECRARIKKLSKASLEIVSKACHVDDQRSSHIMRVKEKLFGSTSPAMHKTSITKGKEIRPNDEYGNKECRQSFRFKGRSLPNLYRKIKQPKDSTQQIDEDIPSLLNNGNIPSDIDKEDQTTDGLFKKKQICCFPIRKLY